MKTVNHFSELDGGSTGQSNLGIFNTEQPVENFEAAANRDGTNTYDLPTLSQQVDSLRGEMKQGFAEIRSEMAQGFAGINATIRQEIRDALSGK